MLRKTWVDYAKSKLNDLMSRTGWLVVLVGGALLVGISILVIVLRRHRVAAREELARERQAAEAERKRIARDLHDEVGSQLARLAALSGADHTAPGMGSGGDLRGSLAATALGAMQAMDAVVWTVKPGQDHLHALADFLADHATRFFDRTPVHMELDLPLDLPESPISPLQRRNILALVKEALTNILKHSKATHTRLGLRVENGSLTIEIRDDGCGFDCSEAGLSLDAHADGLVNMRERSGEIEAALDILSRPGHGTVIRLRVPVAAPFPPPPPLHAHTHRVR